jgi:hypothetical protein
MAPAVSRLIAAALIAAGLVAAGWQVGAGFAAGRANERFVTVKGVAEREVKADLALWPIRYTATGNDLASVQQKIAADAGRVRSFVAGAGLPAESIEVQGLQVVDLLAQPYRSGPIDSRFIISETLIVRTREVDKVAAAGQRLSDLVSAGVVLSGADGGAIQGPVYLFTRLNEIKPAMIAEATRSARAGAEQFAADSGAPIAGIRRASQGLFQILPRDDVAGASEQTQVAKIVRVVTTIDYALAP